MAGTKIGGQRARDKNLKKDPDFYKKLGKIGGSRPKTKPFGFRYMALNNPDRHKKVSAQGGRGKK